MVKGADDVPGLVLDRSWRKQMISAWPSVQTDSINKIYLHYLQPAVSCRTCDQERQAIVCPDWDINHTGLEEGVTPEKDEQWDNDKNGTPYL